MPVNTDSSLLPIALSFVGVCALTPLVRALARRWGVVARPKVDRWHKEPTALLGGIAIAATVTAVDLALLPCTPQALMVLGASVFLFLVGLVDDMLNLKPYQKLIGQVVGAALVVSSGLDLPWTESMPLNTVITIFWLVGITNAVNLLDNMDGLAAGIAAIGAAFLALNIQADGQPAEAQMLAVFGAALLGFLVYNAHPATIFMGDCGSLFIGFHLASLALLHPVGGRSRGFLPVLAVPVLILFIPIFDTFFVMVLRRLAGRAVSQGGRDHTSHRLVALGLSERRAVWMLYGFAAVSGLLGLFVRGAALDVGIAAIAGYTILLAILGVHLAGVKVYDEAEVRAARDKPLVAFLVGLACKRRVFEVLLDLALIVLSYYAAYTLVYGPISGGEPRRRFLTAVPVMLTVKLGTFLILGVYRGLWRYVSIDSLIVIAKAVPVGSLASVLALLFALRFEGLSRVVFVLDGLILLVLLAVSRVSFHLFRRLLPAPAAAARRRVLIYGAGDAGELVVREMLNNPSLRYVPVGFADDDPLKHGKVIHGLRVLGGNGSLRAICERQRVEEVLISSVKISPERIREIACGCRAASVTLKRLSIQIEQLENVVQEPPVLRSSMVHG